MTHVSTENGENDMHEYASSPCFLHELDASYAMPAPEMSPERRSAIMRWRREERARLLSQRLAMPSAVRAEGARQIAGHLDMLLPDLAGLTVSLYWPLRGEPDLRAWAETIIQRGARCALPVVVEKNKPLAFRSWRPGEPMVRGFWNIPVPEKEDNVVPDIALAPVIGFDTQGYRLGYGGGYFDRTLASFQAKPCVIGLGYAQFAIPTIFPLAHDIAMDVIVTDGGIEGYGRKLCRVPQAPTRSIR